MYHLTLRLRAALHLTRVTKAIVPGSLAAMLLFCSCSSLDGAEILFAGEQTQQRLLEQRVEKFNRARYWGAYDEALAYAAPASRSAIMRDWRQRVAKEKLVELNVSDIAMPESGRADLEVQVRYFEQPAYLVKTRSEKQQWRFNRFSGGWQLTALETPEQTPLDGAVPRARFGSTQPGSR